MGEGAHNRHFTIYIYQIINDFISDEGHVGQPSIRTTQPPDTSTLNEVIHSENNTETPEESETVCEDCDNCPESYFLVDRQHQFGKKGRKLNARPSKGILYNKGK